MTQTVFSERKTAVRDWAEGIASRRDAWIARNAFYYADDRRFMRFLVPEGLSVLEIGCGTGELLARLKPKRGVGIDFSPAMIERARAAYPDLTFHVGDAEDVESLKQLGGPFDVIVLSDTVGLLDDCQKLLSQLHALCTRETRLVIAYYSHLWEPALWLAQRLGRKMPQPRQNWLSPRDIDNLLNLADFEPIKREWRQFLPRRAFGLGRPINRYVAPLPGLRRLSLRHYVVARPLRDVALGRPSVSVIIPCRNERGNIEPAVLRTPDLGSFTEIVFVEGHSRDGTRAEIERVIAAYPERRIRLLVQDGIGKGDAMRKGMAAAKGDVLMILDADLTVAPEALTHFYEALVAGKGNLVMGTRLVYPMERQAMRVFNYLGNRGFSLVFSWLLNQRFTDTLCGTKVLTRAHYDGLVAGRSYFGDFDPFGDFDLIFGASKLNLKIVEVPIRYAARRYGATQIDRFRHGWQLLKMVAFAYRKLKGF